MTAAMVSMVPMATFAIVTAMRLLPRNVDAHENIPVSYKKEVSNQSMGKACRHRILELYGEQN